MHDDFSLTGSSTPAAGFECARCRAKFTKPTHAVFATPLGVLGLVGIVGGPILSRIGNGLIEMAYLYSISNTHPNAVRDSGTTIWTVVGWGAFIAGVGVLVYIFMTQKPGPKCPTCGSVNFSKWEKTK